MMEQRLSLSLSLSAKDLQKCIDVPDSLSEPAGQAWEVAYGGVRFVKTNRPNPSNSRQIES